MEMLVVDPYPSAVALPPCDQLKATGSRETPIRVMTVPVTTGGKKRTSLQK